MTGSRGRRGAVKDRAPREQGLGAPDLPRLDPDPTTIDSASLNEPSPRMTTLPSSLVERPTSDLLGTEVCFGVELLPLSVPTLLDLWAGDG